MTLAVCINCGHTKLGALTPCRRCGFAPKDGLEQAKSVLLSDRKLSPDELRSVSERIGRGEPVVYDEAAVKGWADMIPAEEPTYVLGVRRSSWVALGVAVVLGTLLGSCFVGLFHLLRI